MKTVLNKQENIGELWDCYFLLLQQKLSRLSPGMAERVCDTGRKLLDLEHRLNQENIMMLASYIQRTERR